MCDIPWRIPDDGVDRHGNNLMGPKDAWQIPNDEVDRHGHNPMGQEDAWQIPNDRVDRHGHDLMGEYADDAFGDQTFLDTFGNRRL